MTRLTITISEDEFVGLAKLANRELRDPRLHIRYLLQRELTQRGILSTNDNSDTKSAKIERAAVVSTQSTIAAA